MFPGMCFDIHSDLGQEVGRTVPGEPIALSDSFALSCLAGSCFAVLLFRHPKENDRRGSPGGSPGTVRPTTIDSTVVEFALASTPAHRGISSPLRGWKERT